MNRRLGRRVQRGHCNRNKRQHRAVIAQIRLWLTFEVFDKRRADAYRAEQVGFTAETGQSPAKAIEGLRRDVRSVTR